MGRILVTGPGGFIGSHLARHLFQQCNFVRDQHNACQLKPRNSRMGNGYSRNIFVQPLKRLFSGKREQRDN